MATQPIPGNDWSAQIGEQWRRRREAEEAARRAAEIQQRAEAERRGSVYRRGFGIFCAVMFLLGLLCFAAVGNNSPAGIIGFTLMLIGIGGEMFWAGACVVAWFAHVAVEDIREMTGGGG